MEQKRVQPLARDAMAYVLAGGRGSRLMELTDRRAKPAVYFGGKTRIIDFALSNALNSGISSAPISCTAPPAIPLTSPYNDTRFSMDFRLAFSLLAQLLAYMAFSFIRSFCISW